VSPNTCARCEQLRIKIGEKATGTTLYDNVPGASDDVDSASPQLIGEGSISIKAK
jgi:hypothetical protein